MRAQRLRAAREAAEYKSPAAFARAHDDDVVESTYRSHENGTRPLTEQAARKYAGHLGVTWRHLMGDDEWTGEAPAQSAPQEIIEIAGEEYALLRVFDLRYSAGPGAWMGDEHSEPLYYEPHRYDWLRRITSASPGSLFLAHVDGDSMANTLRSGDQVLIDRTRRRATIDGIYAFRRGDELQVKRVAFDPRSGLITIISDNHDYPTWPDVNPDTVDIQGRVIWLGRQV